MSKNERFGDWLVISAPRVFHRSTKVLCQCACGYKRWVAVNALLSGKAAPCRDCNSTKIGS